MGMEIKVVNKTQVKYGTYLRLSLELIQILTHDQKMEMQAGEGEE